MSPSHSLSTHPHAGLSPKSIMLPPVQDLGNLVSQLEYRQRRSPRIPLTAFRLDDACTNGDGICGSFPHATAERTIARNCFRLKSAMCSGGTRRFHGSSPLGQSLYAQSPSSAMTLEGDSCGPLSPKA